MVGKRFFLLPILFLIVIAACGQELSLSLSPVSQSEGSSSQTVVRPLEVHEFSPQKVTFKDGLFSNNFIIYHLPTTNGNVPVCIAIHESTFRIVADVNGNSDLSDDNFYTFGAIDSATKNFPEFKFDESLKLQLNKFAIIPVTPGGQIIYEVKSRNLKNVFFGFITYDALQTTAFMLGEDSFRIHIAKAFVKKMTNEQLDSTGGYFGYRLDKLAKDGTRKMVDFGILPDLLKGKISGPFNSYNITVTLVDIAKSKVFVQIRKTDSDFKKVVTNEIRSISVSTGKMEKIAFSEKPVLFIFSGSWCKGCYEIKPALDDFKKKNATRFKYIYVLREKSLQAAQAFAKKSGYNKNVYFEKLGDESSTTIDSRLGANAYPSIIIVNKRGEVLFNQSGSDLMEQLVKFKF